jgi:hypothetical protein
VASYRARTADTPKSPTDFNRCSGPYHAPTGAAKLVSRLCAIGDDSAQQPRLAGGFGSQTIVPQDHSAAGPKHPFGGAVGKDHPRTRVDQQHALKQPVQQQSRPLASSPRHRVAARFWRKCWRNRFFPIYKGMSRDSPQFCWVFRRSRNGIIQAGCRQKPTFL